jgi:hypothetical protein
MMQETTVTDTNFILLLFFLSYFLKHKGKAQIKQESITRTEFWSEKFWRQKQKQKESERKKETETEKKRIKTNKKKDG